MSLASDLLMASPEEKKTIKEIQSVFFRLMTEKKYDEARKFLEHNKKKYEQLNSK